MFQSIAVLNVSEDNSTQLITGITNPEILIAINGNQTFQNGGLIERSYKSGTVFRIRWNQGGITGNLISLGYGLSEILLNVPSLLDPFDLEIIPGRYQFTYSIEISIRVFNPIYSVLAEKLGISLELLNRIPQQTLQLLNGINLMASADTRNLAQAIENTSNAVVSAQNAADLANTRAMAAQAGTADISANMVINEVFPVPSSSFVLQSSGLYHAVMTLIKIDGVQGVQMSCVDNGGDAQGFSQLISPYLGNKQKATVELTASQLTDGDFPLSFVCQGVKRSTPAPSPTAFTPLLGGFKAVFVNQVLTVTDSTGAAIVTSGADLSGAYYTGTDRIYAAKMNNYFAVTYSGAGAPVWSISSQAEYEAAQLSGVPIASGLN